MFFTVTIVDSTINRTDEPAHRLVEYRAEAITGASAKMAALEHHLARPDRGPTAAVRWAVVEPAAVPQPGQILKISERSLELDELQQLEEINHPYVVA
ncbi:MAG TPA: hypothetical protein VE008_07460 [Burkholderiales bacterium]|nr:hypothetical protein [Burkholderiales bacterium]